MSENEEMECDDGGYDFELVDSSMNDYECPICLMLIRETVELPCTHTLCKLCLKKWQLKESSESLCPSCKVEYMKEKVILSKSTDRIITCSLKVKCKEHTFGCDWTGVIIDYKKHEMTCNFKLVECPGCKCQVLPNRLDNHRDTCQFRFKCDCTCKREKFWSELVGKAAVLLFVSFVISLKNNPQEDKHSYDELYRKNHLRRHLIGHWKMDEVTGTFVSDDSGSNLHGESIYGKIVHGKYTRGRYFNNRQSQGYISIPNNAILHFGNRSFSICGWISVENYERSTAFSARQGLVDINKMTPGWSINCHPKNLATDILICDNVQNKVQGTIKHNPESFCCNKLTDNWIHCAVVFDRVLHTIYLYINGVKQNNSLDISKVTGSIDNNHNLVFELITNGIMDEYRLYNTALDDKDIALIYSDHRF